MRLCRWAEGQTCLPKGPACYSHYPRGSIPAFPLLPAPSVRAPSNLPTTACSLFRPQGSIHAFLLLPATACLKFLPTPSRPSCYCLPKGPACSPRAPFKRNPSHHFTSSYRASLIAGVLRAQLGPKHLPGGVRAAVALSRSAEGGRGRALHSFCPGQLGRD